ncbi:MAG: hypothetical protein U0441_12690 [Polyangiaceae bacterium]
MANNVQASRSKWVVLYDVLISVSSPGVLNDRQWQAFIKDLGSAPISKYLIGSLGTVQSSSVQRKQASDILKSRGIRTAIMTDDTLVRGTVTAMNWLGANIDAFPWAKQKEALKYLDIIGPAADEALDTLMRLRVEVETAAPIYL